MRKNKFTLPGTLAEKDNQQKNIKEFVGAFQMSKKPKTSKSFTIPLTEEELDLLSQLSALE